LVSGTEERRYKLRVFKNRELGEILGPEGEKVKRRKKQRKLRNK